MPLLHLLFMDVDVVVPPLFVRITLLWYFQRLLPAVLHASSNPTSLFSPVAFPHTLAFLVEN